MTLSTTLYESGDVVLVWFRFSSGTDAKRRPAIILSDGQYHAQRSDSIMMAVTSRQTNGYGDCALVDWANAGLLKPSRAKAVLQTILQTSIERRLGKLSANDLDSVRASIHQVFGAWI